MLPRVLFAMPTLGLLIAAAPVTGGDIEAGRITGELRFPSCDQSAPGLEVCAESTRSKDQTCTDVFDAADGRLTYALEVPAGPYVVFARTPVVKEGRFRAYFSEAVRCGLHEGCTDHAPIIVNVAKGEVRREIHPADWVRDLDKEPTARPLTN